MTKYFAMLPGLLLLLAGPPAQAQAPGNNGPTPIPLDGGATLLLAGGVAYGLRRLARPRRR